MNSPVGIAVRIRRLAVGVSVTVLSVLAALLAPPLASATSPVLEFATPGSSLPVGFTSEAGEVNAVMADFDTTVHCTAAHGEEGQVTGPRSAVSKFVFTGCVTLGGTDGGRECKSAAAANEEIKTGEIAAELVYISQAEHAVGMLLNPGGGTYMEFECGGESVVASGSFLSPVNPLNEASTAFTATLSRVGNLQTPNEYESASGERLKAIPMGKAGSGEIATTGVSLQFTITTSRPVEIVAVTAQEVEAKQREEADRAAAELARKHQEEAAAAAAKVHQEEAAAAAAKKQQEEAAAKKAAEEAASKHAIEAKPKPLTRAQLLTKALKQCKQKKPKSKRVKCEAAARKKYGKHKKHKKR